MLIKKVPMFWTIALGVISVALVMVWLKAQYQPTVAVQVAQSFIEYLRSGKLEEAYELTTQKNYVGDTFEKFKVIVDGEWPRQEEIAKVQLRLIHPFQSNGNRIRRWLNGHTIEMPQINVGFFLMGRRKVPFEVRLVTTADGQWKVSYFHAHAL